MRMQSSMERKVEGGWEEMKVPGVWVSVKTNVRDEWMDSMHSRYLGSA